MQDFIPGVFATIVVVSLVSMIVGPIAPSLYRFGRKERPSRKRIFFLSLATLIASFVGFGMTMPVPTPEQKARAEQAAKEQADQAAKAKADEEAAAKAKAEATHDEIMRLWARVTDEGKECDGARKMVAAALEKGDRYRAYEKASAASTACRAANYTVASLPLPEGVASEHKDALREATRACGTAYYAKKQALDAMLKVLDGDARPSAVTAAKEASDFGQLAMMQCATKFVVAAQAAGVPIERFSSGEAKADKPRKTFFPVADGKSVAKCSAEALAFDTNRRAGQAKKVEATCQKEGNASGVPEACRTYANEITNASYKFWRSMESDAGRATILGEEMRAHIGRARDAAVECDE